MIGRLGRRAVDFAVGAFALVGFFSVPLGTRTGWEHTRAILATEPARELGRELLTALDRVRSRAVHDVTAPEGRGARPPRAAPGLLSPASLAPAPTGAPPLPAAPGTPAAPPAAVAPPPASAAPADAGADVSA